MSDLLEELKAERANHRAIQGGGPEWYCVGCAQECNPGGRCGEARALDGMIAGVEGLERQNVISPCGCDHADMTRCCAYIGEECATCSLEAMSRAYRGDDGKD